MGRKLIIVVAVLTVVGVGVIVRQVLDSDDAPASPGARDLAAPAAPRTAVRMPGVAAGDAALATVSKAEAIRRCQLRWNTIEGRTMPSITSVFGPDDGTFNAGEQVVVSPTPISVDDLSQPPRDDMFFCVIPGDLMPRNAELAAAADDRVPAGRQAMLRRCSAVVWHDLSTWTVVTSSVAGGTAGALIALSPSGRYVAQCWLVGKTLGDAYFVGYAMARVRPASEAPRGMRDYSGQYPGHYFETVWDT